MIVLLGETVEWNGCGRNGHGLVWIIFLKGLRKYTKTLQQFSVLWFWSLILPSKKGEHTCSTTEFGVQVGWGFLTSSSVCRIFSFVWPYHRTEYATVLLVFVNRWNMLSISVIRTDVHFVVYTFSVSAIHCQSRIMSQRRTPFSCSDTLTCGLTME